MVTKTAVTLYQYKEKLKEMETKLEDVKEMIVEVEKHKPKEASWVKEEVNKSFADAARQGVVPGILPVTSRIIKEQIQQRRRADDRKANMGIFNVTEEVDEKAYFLNMAELCGLKEFIVEDDIVEVKRIGEPEAHTGDKTRTVLVRINSEDRGKRLFKNLGRSCEVMLNERDPNNKTPCPSIEHDMTVEQRNERKEMVVNAKEEQIKGRRARIFEFVCGGPPDAMRIVKIDTRTGKWDT